MIDWTDDNVARLRALFAEGLSASQISAELGIKSRSEIIGKLHRLGIKRGHRPAAPTAGPSSRHRCDLLGLTNASCRWPVTDDSPWLFCGDPSADFPGKPYCAWHTRMATNRREDA